MVNLRKRLRVLLRLRSRHQSTIFSLSFLQSEQKEAKNIKDKNNRKNVVYILTLIHNQLKLIDNNTNENGILFFFGINRNGEEIKEMIIPPNPVTEFHYKCTKRFETENFENLFLSKSIGHVIFISGIECVIYEFTGTWKKLKSINAELIKRHNKGGQSALRFSRLAEESRTHYITHVVDWINRLIKEQTNNFVFGGLELKNMLINNTELKIDVKTDDMYHTFDDRTIYSEYFKTLMTTPVFGDDKKVDQVVELIVRDPDYLLFTPAEILENIDSVEYIISIKDTTKFEDKNKNVIKLPIGHPKYKCLQSYSVIGKCYVKLDRSFM